MVPLWHGVELTRGAALSQATELDPITTDVGLEFLEIDPAALRMLEDWSGPDEPI